MLGGSVFIGLPGFGVVMAILFSSVKYNNNVIIEELKILQTIIVL